MAIQHVVILHILKCRLYYFGKKSVFLVLFIFQILALMGQTINVETGKFPGVKKMQIQGFRGVTANKTSRSVYHFDNNGNAVKSSHFFKLRCIARYKYIYNDKGLLSEKNGKYKVNNKWRIDTTKFINELDTDDKLTRKTTVFGGWTTDAYYQDFDKNNNPQTIIYPANGIKLVKYNTLNQTT